MSAFTYIAKKGLKHIGSEVGSWLNDTAEETVVGAELTAGTNWAAPVVLSSSTSTWDTAAVTNNRYFIEFDVTVYTSGTLYFQSGTTSHSAGITAIGTYNVSFNATATNLKFFSTDFIGTIDNITLRLSSQDLSTSAHDIAYYGTIVKSPVEAGSNVMGYNGFSNVNYLQQSYNSNLDFGTGDFSIVSWVRLDFASVYNRTILHRSIISSNGGLLFRLSSNDEIQLWGSNSTTWALILSTSTDSYQYGSFMMISVTRLSGVVTIYINDSSIISTNDNTDLSYVNTVTRLGELTYNGDSFTLGVLRSVRMYNTGLTAAQIKTIYNSEKQLFKQYSVFNQVDVSYPIDASLSTVDRSEKPISKKSVSLGGQQETVHQRTDVLHNATINELHKNDLPGIRMFLQSIDGGEPFTYDPYGTVNTPDDPIQVKSDGGHSEQRLNGSNYFSIPIKMREV